jgi:predicted nucleic acid-binding Zn ribbon protein
LRILRSDGWVIVRIRDGERRKRKKRSVVVWWLFMVVVVVVHLRLRE